MLVWRWDGGVMVVVGREVRGVGMGYFQWAPLGRGGKPDPMVICDPNLAPIRSHP